jgi:hypothetical protein
MMAKVATTAHKLLGDPDGLPPASWPMASPAGGVLLAVGPEGGFTDFERALALEVGWTAVSLSRYTLRIVFVILLPTGLLGVLEYWRTGEIKVSAGLSIAAGVFCGAYFGAVMAGAVSELAMKRLYAVFLLVVAIYFLLAPQGLSRRSAEPPPALADGLESTSAPHRVH